MARLIVITGPSGVGKGTLIEALMARVHGLRRSVSVTTRPPRTGEEDGREYHFMTVEQFIDAERHGLFLENAEYAGNRYGTLISEVTGADASVRGIVLEIETEGAAQVRAKEPRALTIFIAPPSADVLRERLSSRGTDAPEVIERRLATAEIELGRRSEFDTVIVNDNLEAAVDQLVQTVEQQLD